MNEKRRDFLKRASVAGAAALATPIAFASSIKVNTQVQNTRILKHIFNVLVVNGKHGSGSLAAAGADKTVRYSGKAMAVKLK